MEDFVADFVAYFVGYFMGFDQRIGLNLE